MGCTGCQLSLFQFASLSEDAGKLRQFLLDHHVVGGVCFCEECDHRCRIDWRRKMFRCDRQVTYRKHGGRSKVKKSHSFAKSLVAGTWIDGFWVFSGFERGSRRTFLVLVPTRDSDTLLTVIKQWIRPGTTVMSDCWRAVFGGICASESKSFSKFRQS